MADKYWFDQSLDDFKASINTEDTLDRPLIGLTIDWKVTKSGPDGKKVLSHPEYLVKLYVELIEQAGGKCYIIGFDEPLESYREKLDGLVIGGGRDIHPMHYGEKINGSMVPQESEDRWEAVKEMYYGLPKSCPLFGICWGLQFFNVIQGGSLVQDIQDKVAHNCKRKVSFKPDSWFAKTCGTELTGLCIHHQVISRAGRNIEAVGLDDHSNYIHAIEVREEGRFIIGTQFHPECSYRNEWFREIDPRNLKMMRGFVEKCTEYKRSRINHNLDHWHG